MRLRNVPPMELWVDPAATLMRNVPPWEHERLHKHIDCANISLAPFIRPCLQGSPSEFSVRKVGAAFYHADIFFKEAKRANRLKATHCLLSPSTISSFHTAQSEVAGPRQEPGFRSGNVSKPGPSFRRLLGNIRGSRSAM